MGVKGGDNLEESARGWCSRGREKPSEICAGRRQLPEKRSGGSGASWGGVGEGGMGNKMRATFWGRVSWGETLLYTKFRSL